MDWNQWLDRYETNQPLRERLTFVVSHIAKAILDCHEDPVPVLSVCAGDGRDLVVALSSMESKRMVRADLIESNPDVVSKGRNLVAEHGLSQSVKFRCADATKRRTYQYLTPAKVVIVSGVFGNLRDIDAARLIRLLHSLCQPDSLVIWTRNLVEFDDGGSATDKIREILRASDYEETRFERTQSGVFAIATHRYRGQTKPLPTDEILFDFSGFWKLQNSL